MFAILAGCGRSDRSPLAQVTGTVTCMGKPLEEAQIVFHNPDGRSAHGRIEDGEIVDIITYDVLNDGVPIGRLTVTIHPVIESDAEIRRERGEKFTLPKKPLFPPRYSDPKQSNLIAEIEAGINDVHFDLTD